MALRSLSLPGTSNLRPDLDAVRWRSSQKSMQQACMRGYGLNITIDRRRNIQDCGSSRLRSDGEHTALSGDDDLRKSRTAPSQAGGGLVGCENSVRKICARDVPRSTRLFMVIGTRGARARDPYQQRD